jgi:hypothetical protein
MNLDRLDNEDCDRPFAPVQDKEAEAARIRFLASAAWVKSSILTKLACYVR